MTKQSFVGVLVAIIVVVLSNSLYVIRETQRGVLLKFGEVVDPDLSGSDYDAEYEEESYCGC